MIRNILIVFFGLIPLISYATHARGGEITYEHISGLTYRFKITTCTNVNSGTANADRSELYITYGDGEGDTIPRVIPVTSIPGFPDHQKNIYIGVHTFVTSGSYLIEVEDPNRNANILNIYPNTQGGTSDNVVFALQSKLVINPFLGNGGINNSLIFDDCPCPAIACVGKEYCYNPKAVDPDGDILSYELVAPLGLNSEPLPIPTVYLFPNQIDNAGTMSIDPSSGTMCWDSPNQIGEFNFTIKITEWRNGFEVGYVYRDVQLTVQSLCNNDPPVIDPIPPVCVIAGETVQFNVNATDPNNGDVIDLTASGQPFLPSSNPASFMTLGNNPVNGTFSWLTDCSHIKLGDYQVLFAAQDNGNPLFSDYEQATIKIIPPKLTGISAAAFGNGVNISWNPATCSNAEGYRIYRTTNPNFVMPDCCDNPNPENVGFTQVGEVFGINTTTFFDNTSLTLGIDYCYVITAFYATGQVESCPSDSACTRLKKEVPIITHVTVNNTDVTAGVDSVIWSKPTELDTVIFPGPYYYKVYHGTSINNINGLLGQTSSSLLLANTDTVFTHANVNTSNAPNFYRVELFYTNNGADSLVGSSNKAGSVFVTTTPNDNQITLNWSEDVPWIDTAYVIYRGTSIGGIYTQIGTTNNQFYTDTDLINGQTYCYYVKSIGYYSSPSIISPIENLSQEVCDTPIDKTPPCPPILNIEGDCLEGVNKLFWNNPNNNCADDVTRYNIYYTSIEGDSMELIASINSELDTVFYHSNNGSVAGCYAVTALDSVLYGNESDSSNVVCFDNCPIYFLPNVFTPNNDGKNEYFTPLSPYRYIESIDLDIYNRWGQIVFQTTDPVINWDGIHKDSGEPVPSGVYYFICTVNTIRLSGIDPVELKGFFHLFRDNEGE